MMDETPDQIEVVDGAQMTQPDTVGEPAPEEVVPVADEPEEPTAAVDEEEDKEGNSD